MSIHKRNINSIIKDRLTGELTEDDGKRLEAWLESSQENRAMYEEFLSASNLVERYESYSSADEQKAWLNFRNKHLAAYSIKWKRVLRYAAVFMLPIAGAIVSLWMLLQKMDSKPQISPETRIMMKRSEQMGKQKATLVFADGKKIDLEMPLLRLSQEEEDEASPLSSPQDYKKDKGSEFDNNQLITNPDSEYWVVLEDGTIVHLNYNTTLKYPSHFNSRERTVYLNGEAYFEVAKDRNRPFRVVTSAGVVTQYGTSFNVNTHTEGSTKVVLEKGSISVTPQVGEERMIKPGELAVLYAAHPNIEVRSVDVDPYVAWNTGRFVFENCLFEDLMNVISIWYGKNIIFESDDIRKMLFTGDIDRYGSIVPVMNAIKRVTDLEVITTDENIILRNRNNKD